MLFVLTCVSTFWAWCGQGRPDLVLYWAFGGGHDEEIRAQILAHWQDGLIYMACVLAILFAHEMGHFLMTLRYRVAASLPYFLPVPFSPIGTMGAVISMDGLSADRRQIFDIGIAGPLAGLIVAIPVTWFGVKQLDLTSYDASRPDLERVVARNAPAGNQADKVPNEQPAKTQEKRTPTDELNKGFAYHMPWLVSFIVDAVQPEGYTSGRNVPAVPMRLMNPYLMAGWVGLLITGLNMMPISQLDGGHVIYGLFGKRAHVIARISLFVAIFFVVLNFERVHLWTVMLLLVTLMGTDHPPTANDDVPLGRFRTALGWASLSIPFICFPFYGLWQLT